MNNITQISIGKSVFTDLIYSVAKNFSSDALFPGKVKEFVFEHRIKRSKKNTHYAYAVYKDRDGKKAFMKVWNGTTKDLFYKYLKNEVKTYEIFSNARKRIAKTLNNDISSFYFPKVYAKIEPPKSYKILVEHANGKTVADFSDTKKLEIILKAREYLQELGKGLTTSEVRDIDKRRAENLILFYPILLAKALITHPAYWRYLFAGVKVFIREVPALLKQKELVLTHRDLHDENIINSRGKFFIIDTTYCAYTIPEYELIIILGSFWNKLKLRKLILKKLNRENDNTAYIKALMVNFATHVLSGSDLNRKNLMRYSSYLKYAVN